MRVRSFSSPSSKGFTEHMEVPGRGVWTTWFRAMFVDTLRATHANQAGARVRLDEPTLGQLVEVFNANNRGIRGKVFEAVLVGAINRGDIRLISPLAPVMQAARISPPYSAVHVAFDQMSAEEVRQSLTRDGWHPAHIQYLDGKLGAPRNLLPLLDYLARALRRPGSEDARLAGAEKADLWVGNKGNASAHPPLRGRLVGVTVKLTENLLVPTNVRAAMFSPTSPNSITTYDPRLGYWRVPVPRGFMADFAACWNLLMLLLDDRQDSDGAREALRGAGEVGLIYKRLTARPDLSLADVEHLLERSLVDRLRSLVINEPLPSFWTDEQRARSIGHRPRSVPKGLPGVCGVEIADREAKAERPWVGSTLPTLWARSGWCMTGYCRGCPTLLGESGWCPCACHDSP